MRPGPVRRSGRKFRAFRAWTLDGYRLRSANPAGGHWTPGVNRAECRRSAYDRVVPMPAMWAAPGVPGPFERSGAAHRAPDPSCRCGLYAWHDPGRLLGFVGQRAELVYGVVLAWGRIEVHADGLRAEYAEPVILAYRETQTYRHVRRVQAIGSELGLPVVELDELEEAAMGFGEPVPPELRPKRIPAFEVDPRWGVPLAASGILLAAAGLVGGLRQAQRRATTSAGGSTAGTQGGAQSGPEPKA